MVGRSCLLCLRCVEGARDTSIVSSVSCVDMCVGGEEMRDICCECAIACFVHFTTNLCDSWPRRRFLEFPFGNLGVWRGVEIGKFLEIWGSGEVWKLEIPEIRPSKCLISSPVEI